MHKRIILFFLAAVSVLTMQAQRPDPVHLTYTVKKISDSRFELHVIAVMDEGWHVYAQAQPEDAIAVPTKIEFTKNPLLVIGSGVPKEIGTKEKYEDKAAGIVQYQYGKKLELIQVVERKAKAKAKTNLAGTVTYQACTDEMCLPPKTVPFSVSLE